MIQARNLQKRFGKLTVLQDVSFEISAEGIFAVLGPNGSGKTTILKMILGMVIPQNGQVTFDGTNIKEKWDYRRKIGYLPQIARFPDNLTVSEVISMIKDIRNEPSNDEQLLEKFQLKDQLKKKLGTLSGGTRQKVNIVLTFMFDSPVYVLDEPTAGLDPVSLIKLKEIITEKKQEGKIILITTHILPLVEEMADQIIFPARRKNLLSRTSRATERRNEHRRSGAFYR